MNTTVVTQDRGLKKVVVAQARSSARNLLIMDVGSTMSAKVRFSRKKAIFRGKHHNNHRFLLKHWCCLLQVTMWLGDLPRKEGDVCSRYPWIQEIGFKRFSFYGPLSALTTRLRLF